MTPQERAAIRREALEEGAKACEARIAELRTYGEAARMIEATACARTLRALAAKEATDA